MNEYFINAKAKWMWLGFWNFACGSKLVGRREVKRGFTNSDQKCTKSTKYFFFLFFWIQF